MCSSWVDDGSCVTYQRRLVASQDDGVDIRVILFQQNNLLNIMLHEKRWLASTFPQPTPSTRENSRYYPP